MALRHLVGIELVMGAAFPYGAVIQNHNIVGVTDGCQMVGNSDGGAASHQRAHGWM